MTKSATSGFEPELLAPLHVKWRWIVALGVVYFIAGLIALGWVFTAIIATVYVVGVMMFISGVVEVLNAFEVKNWGSFVIWRLLGILYIAAGLASLENPLLSAAQLTIILGAALTASGIVRTYLGFNMKAEFSSVLVMISGAITFVIGVIILLHWLFDSVYTLGALLGLDLIFAGVSWIRLVSAQACAILPDGSRQDRHPKPLQQSRARAESDQAGACPSSGVWAVGAG